MPLVSANMNSITGPRLAASPKGASALGFAAHRLAVAEHPLVRVGDAVDLVLEVAHGARHAGAEAAIIHHGLGLAAALERDREGGQVAHLGAIGVAPLVDPPPIGTKALVDFFGSWTLARTRP